MRRSVSKTLRGRGSTGTPCHFYKSRGSQVGRQRPHKPSMSGFDCRSGGCADGAPRLAGKALSRHAFPPPPSIFMGRSIIQEVTRLASGNAWRGSAFVRNAERTLHGSRSCKARCKAVAVHHFYRGEVENPGSFISFLIVVRLTLRRPCGERSPTREVGATAPRIPRPATNLGLVAA